MKNTTIKLIRIISAVLLAVLFVTASPVSVSAANKSVTLVRGLDSAAKKGYDTHGWEKNYKKSFWGAYAGHNCTNYAAYMAAGNGAKKRVSGNAVDWKKNAEKQGYKTDTTPAVGAIAWWNGTSKNKYGHVAYVESVGDGYIVISEDGWGVDGKKDNFAYRKIYKGDGYPNAFLHLADVKAESNADDNKETVNSAVQTVTETVTGAIAQVAESSYWTDWTYSDAVPCNTIEMQCRSRYVFTEYACVYDISALEGDGWIVYAKDAAIDSSGQEYDIKWHMYKTAASEWYDFIFYGAPEDRTIEVQYRYLISE